MQWLAYSARPLRVEEVAEVVAIDFDHLRFDAENRLPDPRDVLTICSSLVTIAASTAEIDGVSCEIEELRLAHFSVKEYLISNCVRTGSGFQYNIRECAEDRLAQGCLIYLLQFQGSTLLSPNNIDDFPLARYTAEHWTRHTRAARDGADQIDQLSIQLFQSKGDAYINWIRLFDPDMPWRGADLTKSISDVACPLYYASLEGLVKPAAHLLEKDADANAQGGAYDNALQAASARGHEAIATLLLEKGANVNAQGRYYSSALQVASAEGHEAIATLLLKKGANVNAQGGDYGSALQAASAEGHKAIVTLLLEKGANVNTQGGDYGSALQAASAGGHEAITTLLLEKGANVNRIAFRATSVEGHEAIAMALA